MSDIDNVSWNYPTPIWFGLGRSLEIPNALEAQGMQNPLIVTDPEFTSNKNFINNAPEKIIRGEKEKELSLKDELTKINSSISMLS